MQVEEALLKLGSDPIHTSPFSRVLLAVINSYLSRAGDELITLDTPGDVALSQVYGLSLSHKALRHEVGNLRDRDMYRLTLTYVAGLVGLIVMVIALIEIFNVGSDGSGQGVSILVKLIDAGVMIMEKLVTE